MSKIRFTENEYDKLLLYVKTILELNKNSDVYSYEVLIKDAGYENIVEVEVNQFNCDHEEQDHFMMVESHQEVMEEHRFPDGHYDYFHSEEEFNQVLNEWLEDEKSEGRTWVPSQYHTSWYVKEEAENRRQDILNGGL